MNVIWIVADTLRKDHLGAYGNPWIHTPNLDALAARSVRFQRHYAGGFPTMPARADYFTGRWSMSFMGWEPLPQGQMTLAQMLMTRGYHTAAVVDTPFYVRHGMNYDRGFQTFVVIPGQEGGPRLGHHEADDVRAAWRHESDRNAPRTVQRSMEWLERHYRERFFLYIDLWDPHEPWDAPAYYSRLYWPDHDGEVIAPPYARWADVPGFTEERVRRAHAAYCGEVTLVDRWVGQLLEQVELMGLLENTAIVFTSDHGFYFGEHGGRFGKMTFAKRPDGRLFQFADEIKGEIVSWDHSPLYEELAAIPLLIYEPGAAPGVCPHLTSAVDLMPTVLDFLGEEIPPWVEGQSLSSLRHQGGPRGREVTFSSIPFANSGDFVWSVDNTRRELFCGTETTVTTREWSLLYTLEPGLSELYHLPTDLKQERNVIADRPEIARELHQLLVRFMRETQLAPRLLEPRLALRL